MRLVFDCFFFFIDAAPSEIYTLSLHDALPILAPELETRKAKFEKRRFTDECACGRPLPQTICRGNAPRRVGALRVRSEEHTSELQSRFDLVCRLLLEKKKQKT